VIPRVPGIPGLLHGAHRLLDRPHVRAFDDAARDPMGAQDRRLRRFLGDNAGSAYGIAHGYGRITSVRMFQDRVPVLDADSLVPWVSRIAEGEPRVLTAAPVRMLERTSGTAAGDKLVPYTTPFLGELRAALAPWLADLFRARPTLRGLRQYWSLSPAARAPGRTPGGVSVGFQDDTDYLSPVFRAAMRRLMAVPGTVARIQDISAWRRRTLVHLLEAEDLGLVSVWSPSFLTLLMQALERELPDYLSVLSPKRAAAVRTGLDAAGRLVGEAVWPRLQVISCWADGPAAAQIDGLRAWFPDTPIQGKGLLATEGVVSFPLWRHGEVGAVAAATSHFLEFLDLDAPTARPRLVHELRVGGAYSPLLTTGGGLARYHLQDVLRCTGHRGALPLLRFEGKLDRVSDRAGEKLVAARVEAVLRGLAGEMELLLDFALLAPLEEVPPRYVLFVESTATDACLERLTQRLDAALAEDHHYGYCRQLGQLGPPAFQRVSRGWETYQRTLVEAGARLGDIKPTNLDGRTVWGDVFGVGAEA
jgi:hypothetical protein